MPGEGDLGQPLVQAQRARRRVRHQHLVVGVLRVPTNQATEPASEHRVAMRVANDLPEYWNEVEESEYQCNDPRRPEGYVHLVREYVMFEGGYAPLRGHLVLRLVPAVLVRTITHLSDIYNANTTTVTRIFIINELLTWQLDRCVCIKKRS